MVSASTLDRFGRVLFYLGVSIFLGFIAWMQVAPYAGQNPEWWNGGMARAAMFAMVILTLSILVALAAGVWDASGKTDSTVEGGLE